MPHLTHFNKFKPFLLKVQPKGANILALIFFGAVDKT